MERREQLDAALAQFAKPGAYLITRLGVLPESPVPLTVARHALSY